MAHSAFFRWIAGVVFAGVGVTAGFGQHGHSPYWDGDSGGAPVVDAATAGRLLAAPGRGQRPTAPASHGNGSEELTWDESWMPTATPASKQESIKTARHASASDASGAGQASGSWGDWSQPQATDGNPTCSGDACGTWTECAPCDEMACHDPGCACPTCRGSFMGFEFFGEYLYLRPRNVEVGYAVPIDGPVTPVNGNGIQIGDTRTVEMDYRSGYRVGINAVTTICGRLTGQWTRFESRDTDQFAIGSPNLIRSLVTHSLGQNAATDGLQTSASYDIDFELVDLAVQTPLCRGACWAADLLWGVRYGQLDQGFNSSIGVNGVTSVATDIDFSGVGPRMGLIGQRNLGFGTLYMFGRGEGSFLMGSFDAAYLQADTFAGTQVVSGLEAGRVVPQLEFELGLGCGSRSGRFQLRAGYLMTAWLNTIVTDEFIHAVQNNSPNRLGDGITFDGLAIRSEVRF